MQTIRIDTWALAQLDSIDPEGSLARAEWRPTRVPGVVQTSSYGLPKDQLYRQCNTECVAWMAERTWAYRAAFDRPQVEPGEEAALVFHGLDYRCDVRVDGRVLCAHEGMFSTVEVALDDVPPGRHELTVVLYPPADFDAPLREHAKARFAIGWDWAPKLVTIGIWDAVELVVRPQLRIERAWIETRLANAQRAECVVHAQLSRRVERGFVDVALAGMSRAFALLDTDRLRLPIHVSNPPLWWPNGCGRQNLVNLHLQLRVEGCATEPFVARCGLREVRRAPAHGQRPEDLPLQLVINGRPVFIKGANWVPADSCIADLDRERYALFLRQFADADFNLLRVWGGGLIEKDAFYDLADELGLMVMQEFPLACELPPETERYLRIIEAEARNFVPRLNRHPSIVVWTGGNEHYHYWDALESGTPAMQVCKDAMLSNPSLGIRTEDYRSGVAPYDHLSLNHIASLLAELDGSRPFQPTSGMEGEGEPHGIWNWDPRIGDQRMRDFATLYDFWNAQREHLYSEAAVEGIANRPVVEFVLETQQPAVPEPDDVVWRHHKAFEACWPIDRGYIPDPRSTLWLDLASIDALFGHLNDLDDLIAASQWLQAEGGRYLVEELRRKMPHACGVIWWGANEPWPNLAGNQLIDYFGQPRPALRALANAFRPTILSLRYRHCVTRQFKPELWISHDGLDAFRGQYRVVVEDLVAGNPVQEVNGCIRCEPYESALIRVLRHRRLTSGSRLRVTCLLCDEEGQPAHCNEYLFASCEDVAPMRFAISAGVSLSAAHAASPSSGSG